VQSGRAGLGPDVYKRKPRVLVFSFSRPSRFISDRACDDGGCPRARAAVVPRFGVVAAVPRSVAAAPWSRGRATVGPLCGQPAASPGRRGGGTSKVGEEAVPLDV
jgi:hypothetical protein